MSKSAVGPAELDLDKLAHYLQECSDGLVRGDLSATPIAGGKSNLTYTITDGHSRWVLRRPPLNHVLPTAHDMVREYTVMSALAGSGVAVPAMVLLCECHDVLGAPFLLMEHVDGAQIRTAEQLDKRGSASAGVIVRNSIDTLATLHLCDPQDVGLGSLGRGHGYVPRQVSRWARQLESSRTRELAGARELLERLQSSSPTQQRISVVHGDYRLDNLLIGDDDRVRAVVDWEMATLGDPLADLALMLIYGRAAQILPDDELPTTSLALAHPTERELIEAYTLATGLEVSDLGYYLALACFKLAVIIEGINLRRSGGDDGAMRGIGDAVEPLIALGLSDLASLR